jgi:hypothetical protein
MFEKINVRKWTRRDWVLLSIFAVITLAGIAVGHLNDPTSAAPHRARAAWDNVCFTPERGNA